MLEYVYVRTLEVGTHMVKFSSTIRQTADVFKVSKSTVHIDVTIRLPLIDIALAKSVRAILDHNAEQSSSRGGKGKWRNHICY